MTNTLERKVIKVPLFFKKVSYKKMYHAKAINKYYYVDDVSDQRNTLTELIKRRTTAVNLLITALNRAVIELKVKTNDLEAFKNKWKLTLNNLKRAKLSDLDRLEEEILLHINSLKSLKI